MDLGKVKLGGVDLAAKLEGGAVELSARVPVEQAIFMLVDKLEEAIPGDQKPQAAMLKELLKLKLAG